MKYPSQRANIAGKKRSKHKSMRMDDYL